MRIILVGINFGNYEKRIVEVMRKQGHEVFYMYDTAPKYTFYLRTFGKNFAEKKNIDHQKRMLKEMGEGYDKVIVIVGRHLHNFFLDEIKEKNPGAEFSLYLWDDVKRVENYENSKQFYEKTYSFDLKDCKEYGFQHLPLFFSIRPEGNMPKEYDIYSAMFSHSERERIIESISAQVQKSEKKGLFYISLGRFSYLKRYSEIKNNTDPNLRYISKPIPESENYQNMEKAKTILDVQFQGQIGLTMRTVESLGMKNKLITTNPSVRYYDFYNENNVTIIDRADPQLEVSFLDKPYIDISGDIYEKYSLDTWVAAITEQIELPNYIGDNRIEGLSFD